jgi:hypothetical protein
VVVVQPPRIFVRKVGTVQPKAERLTQIFQEVLTLARRFGKVDWDEKEGSWVFIYELPLPPQYDKEYTSCLIELPPKYPDYPPKDGSYVDPDLGIESSHYCSDGRTFRGKPFIGSVPT